VERVRAEKPLIDSIKFSRDKFYAHFHGKYFDNPKALVADKPLGFQDVAAVIELCRRVLNWVESNVLDCPVSYWGDNHGKEEFDRLLTYIRRYLKMCEEIGKRLGSGELLEMIKP
jgi:hypothetical protein